MMLEASVAEDLYSHAKWKTCYIKHISEYPVPHKKDDSKIKYLIDIQKILNGTKRSY